MPRPEESPKTQTSREHTPAPGDLAPGDYYFEGPYLVFTEAYHLRRGYCCNSGCRHCPWREAAE